MIVSNPVFGWLMVGDLVMTIHFFCFCECQFTGKKKKKTLVHAFVRRLVIRTVSTVPPNQPYSKKKKKKKALTVGCHTQLHPPANE